VGEGEKGRREIVVVDDDDDDDEREVEEGGMNDVVRKLDFMNLA